MFISMLDEYQKNKSKYDISSLRTGFISGSNVPEVVVNRIQSEFKIHEMTQGYGQTECSPVVYMAEAKDPFPKRAKTVGRITPMVESKIINPETGNIVPWGEPGEICVRGYLVMKGYWNDPEKTKETIDEKGWLKTGDLGQLDEDGFLHVIGRSKDMVIRGGENIYPREIEEYLIKNPSISDV